MQEGSNEIPPAAQIADGLLGFEEKLFFRFRCQVRHLVVLQMPPCIFDWVQLRRIGR